MQEFVHLREGDEVAETVQQLLRELRDNDEIADKVAVKWGAQTWTWREHLDEAARQAAALIGLADPDRPLHVGVLLGNTPDMLTAMMFQIIEGVAKFQDSEKLNVSGDIMTRFFNEMSNGMLGYNQALQVALLPFPYPCAQLLAWFLSFLFLFCIQH